MKVKAEIQKWGNGLAIRISGVMCDIPRFKEGMPIEVEVFEDGLTIHKLPGKTFLKLPFSETALLKEMTPETAHANSIANSAEGEY